MSSEIRPQFIQEVITLLLESAEPNERLYIKDLAYTFEDIFLIVLVKEYYLSKYPDGFINYIKSLTLESLNNHAPRLYTIFNEFREELRNTTTHIVGKRIRIVGDVHPQNTTKVKVDDHIVFSERFSNNTSFQDLIETCLQEYKRYIPTVKKDKDLVKRDFVEANVSAKSLKEIDDYYYNFGFIMPLFLYLRTTDLHAENVIASLPFPIFFDLECMFMPEESDNLKYNIDYTGFVKTDQIDQSSLTGGLKTIDSLLKPILYGTEKEPRIKWKVPSSGKLFNVPTIDGSKINVLDYANQLERGILAGYEYIESEATNIKSFFNETEFYTRILMRPTRVYRMLMCKYYLPNNYDVSPREFYKHELNQIEYLTEFVKEAELEKIIDFEISCLEKNLIPIFFSEIHNASVFNSKHEIVGQLTSSQFQTWQKYIDLEFPKQKVSVIKAILRSLDS